MEQSHRKMPKGSRLLILLPATALLMVLALVVWTLGQASAPLRLWRLRDGSTVAVEGVTYGQEHRFLHGLGWQKLFLQWLPRQAKIDFMRRNGCRDIRLPSRKGDALVIWLFDHKSSRTSPWYPRIVALDAAGRESQEANLAHVENLNHPPTERFEAWQIPSFPRRDNWVRLRLYNRTRDRSHVRVGEITLPNPAPGPHPTWTPQPLPATRRAGDLSITLSDLTTGLDREEVVAEAGPTLATVHGDPVARARGRAWTRAAFQVTRAGKPETAWEPVSLVATDATGNTFEPLFRAPFREAGTSRLYFGGTLWPEEPAWKLRVQFARARGFAPAELWTVANLSAPALGGSVDSPASLQRDGVTLQILELRANEDFADRRRRTGKRFLLQVFTRLSPRPEGTRLTLVRATDGRGQPLAAQFEGEWESTIYFQVHSPTPVTKVNLTFAVHRSRFVEFVAKPSRS